MTSTLVITPRVRHPTGTLGTLVPMSHPPSPAVIFDLDGTLVDSEPNYCAATRQVLAAHGVPGYTWEDHTRFIGIGTMETLATLQQQYDINAPLEELLAAKNQSYLALARGGTGIFPQMQKLVELLHAAGHPLAVASGSSRAAIDAVLEGTPLGRLLPIRVSAEDVDRGKPEADVFLAAARELGVPAAGCVVLEDAPPGAEAARRAEMRCVAVPSVPDTADHPEFAAAGLLFRGGQQEFDAQRAYDWITG